MPEYTNSQITEVIDEWIHSERHRNILKRKLVDGIAFEPLAEEFDMSPRGMKYLVYKLQKQVFKHLNPLE